MECIDAVAAKTEDDEILHRANLAGDLTEVYSNGRIKLAANRRMVTQLLKVDISEMFSPERVTTV